METPDMPEESNGEVDTEATPGDSPVQARISPETDSDIDPWLPLRAASEQAGVSVSALRKWYRLEKIQSELRPGPTGDQRFVLLSEVMKHAGRLHRGPKVMAGSPPAPAAPAEEEPITEAPPGQMLLPLSAWETMMKQLANLHEAGQMLADARADAARFEERYNFEQERRKIEQERREAAEARIAELEEARQAQPQTPDDPMPAVQVGSDTIDQIVEAARIAAQAEAKPGPEEPDELDELNKQGIAELE